LTPSLASDIRLHPYEDAYFNELIGGLHGAQAAGVGWTTDYWGTSYLRAVRWANTNLELGATIVAPVGGHLIRFDGLRRDIKVEFEAPSKPPAGPAYVVFITRDDFSPSWLEAYKSRKPLFEVTRSGVALMKAFRLDPRLPPFTGGSTARVHFRPNG
jgi:hypothetical protein